jgi:diguanylate cyclase (GGDEF)-like protein
VASADQLAAELIALEDRFVWDVPATAAAAAGIERAAVAIGAEELAVRARLVQASMLSRLGNAGAGFHAARNIDQWAADHDLPMIRARAHLVLAAVHRHLGDPGKCLDHAVMAVEYLDDTATVHAQVWHRVKLADALADAGSTDAARTRFQQAERLASVHGEHRLHMAVLNNFAYQELCAGEFERAQEVAARLQSMAVRYGFDLDPADLDTIGAILIENGRYSEAELMLRDCIALHGQGHHDADDALVEYLLHLSQAQRCLGALDEAEITLTRGKAICARIGLNEVLVRFQQEQAELHAARGEYAEAYALHKVFHAQHEILHSQKREAQARERQAMFETSEARREAEEFREQARRDPLTSLRNRRYVDEVLPGLIADPAEPVTIALLDLDHFKRINDELSHEVGDQVLVAVARLLENAVPAGSFAARMGGEEFLLVLPALGQNEAIAELERVREIVGSHGWLEITGALPVTVSIGVASTHDGAELNQADLLSAADRNLYVAKHGGRDQVVSDLGVAGKRARRRTYRDAPRTSHR